MTIIPQAWVSRPAIVPAYWWPEHAPRLVARVPQMPALVRDAAQAVGVDERLLVTRMQLEQSALTYAWDGSTTDYSQLTTAGGQRDVLKLRYLCGVDRTDRGDRDGGWFGAERQLLGCALRFKHWYRGEDGPRAEWRNWLRLREDPAYRAGVPVTRGGVTITPANQASADALRYTTSMPAQERLRQIGLRYFPEDYAAEEAGDVVSIRQHTVAEFVDYLEAAKRRGAVLKATFLHHTWKPTAADYRGLGTILAIRKAHLARDFSDIACHAYAAPDGTVYNARPPSTNNCACHAPTKPAIQWPAELRAISNGNKHWPNQFGFGMETVGNFDEEDPAQSRAMATSLDVLAAVHRVWNIPVERCFFHRDVSAKSCPGNRVTKAWVHTELRKRLEGETMPEVDVDEWAREAVERMKAAKIMLGKTEDWFGGREPVTRQEVAVVADRLLNAVINNTPWGQ